MASKEKKIPDNVKGKYYVDEDCIGCSACVAEAPDNFQMNDDSSIAFVYKQPDNDTEEAVCSGTKETCPVDAIGDDGE